MSSPFAETNMKAAEQPAPMPGGSTRTDSAKRQKARREMKAEDALVANILPGHRLAFKCLRHDEDGDYGLISCTVNGYPSALVVAGRECEQGVEIMPLFVALTAGMTICGPNGETIYQNGGVA